MNEKLTRRPGGPLVVGLVLLLIVVAGGTYLIVDPQFGDQEEYTVDTTARPSVLAYQSIQKLRHSDYRLHKQTVVTNTTSRNQRTTAETLASVENRRQRYRISVRVFTGDDTLTTHWFRNDAMTYTRDDGGPWRVANTGPYDIDNANVIGDPTPLRSANVNVADESDSTVTLRITDRTALRALTRAAPSPTPREGEGNETMRVTIRKADGLPVLIERRITDRRTHRTFHVKMRFSDYGNVTVERPDGLGFRFEELFYDLLRAS